MRYLLDRDNVGILQALAQREAVLAFDFDGTLAPIVDDPAEARMRSRTRCLLAVVARQYACAVISGRALADLEHALEGFDRRIHLVGNHGAEAAWTDPHTTRARRARVAAWRAALAPGLTALPAVRLEDKGDSLALHYRAAREPARTRRALRRLVRPLEGAHAIFGKLVVDVVPRDAPDKADALAGLCRMVGASAALYLGDDTTDEAVFGSRAVPDLLAIRVGWHRRTAAPWYLRRQDEVDDVLAVLAAARSRPAVS